MVLSNCPCARQPPNWPGAPQARASGAFATSQSAITTAATISQDSRRFSVFENAPSFAFGIVASATLRSLFSKLTIERLEGTQQLVRCGGDVADARAGRVVDGIDNGGARPADAKLADALAVERTAVRIGFVQKHDVQ